MVGSTVPPLTASEPGAAILSLTDTAHATAAGGNPTAVVLGTLLGALCVAVGTGAVGLGLGVFLGSRANRTAGDGDDPRPAGTTLSLLALPVVLLAALSGTLLHNGWVALVLLLVALTLPAHTDLVRREFLRVWGLGHVEAARALGLPARSLWIDRVLPAMARPVVVDLLRVLALALAALPPLVALGLFSRSPLLGPAGPPTTSLALGLSTVGMVAAGLGLALAVRHRLLPALLTASGRGVAS